MNVLKWCGVVVTFLVIHINLSLAQTTLKMNQYITQVEGGNEALQASQETMQSAALRSKEGRLQLMPYLNATAQWTNDRKPTSSPIFQGNETDTRYYTLGISQMTPIGLSAKVGYNVTNTEIFGASSTYLTDSKYFDTHPYVELTMPLWRNFLGSETNSQIEAVNSSAKATSYSESYKFKAKKVEAEIAYSRLALSREAYAVQKESFERAQKLKDWNARRAHSQLADRVDLLQAEAALELRRLEMQSAEDEVKAAARSFNALRGMHSDEVSEELEIISPETIEQFSTVESRAVQRDDVSAAIESYKAAEASSQIGKQKNSPILEAFSGYSFNGREGTLAASNKEAFQEHNPTWYVGVRLGASFDLGGAADVREGYLKEIKAAELNMHRKLFDQEEEWRDLKRKFNEMKKKFEMARNVERIQKDKLEYERNRFGRGRTTTYQVLMFEQDYALAQFSRIQIQSGFMQILSQLKLFSDASPVFEGTKNSEGSVQ